MLILLRSKRIVEGFTVCGPEWDGLSEALAAITHVVEARHAAATAQRLLNFIVVLQPGESHVRHRTRLKRAAVFVAPGAYHPGTSRLFDLAAEIVACGMSQDAAQRRLVERALVHKFRHALSMERGGVSD